MSAAAASGRRANATSFQLRYVALRRHQTGRCRDGGGAGEEGAQLPQPGAGERAARAGDTVAQDADAVAEVQGRQPGLGPAGEAVHQSGRGEGRLLHAQHPQEAGEAEALLRSGRRLQGNARSESTQVTDAWTERLPVVSLIVHFQKFILMRS